MPTGNDIRAITIRKIHERQFQSKISKIDYCMPAMTISKMFQNCVTQPLENMKDLYLY